MSVASASPRLAPSKSDLQKRQSLCDELVGIHKKHAATFDRVDAIKSELKQLATDAGESFKISIAGKGEVNVSGSKKGAYKGDLPILQSDAWLGLTEKQREKHIETGLIKIEAQFGGDYYGAVKVKLF